MTWRPWLVAALVATGCSSSASGPSSQAREPASWPAPAAASARRAKPPPSPGARPSSAVGPAATTRGAPPQAPPDGEPIDELIAAAFELVSQTRGLPIRQPVRGRRLTRDQIIKRIIAKVERDMPEHALRAQGELLGAFGLIDADYDYVAGVYKLIKGQVAGFYDPDLDRMFLVDDLGDESLEETLSHELVHALQDQHYDLSSLLDYSPGNSDRTTARHAFCEGDATSAMFDISAGSAFAISETVLRLALVASTALSEDGATTPRVLQAALVAPYVDGFKFVQQLRRQGGWPAVDAVWRALPATTEQLLHMDKYLSREPALPVAVPDLAPLGAGWAVDDHDVVGEQGLRITLEQWTHRKAAAEAAAGWGGDRYVVARRPKAPAKAAAGPDRTGGGSTEHAVAWLVRFDTAKDAGQMAAVLRKTFGTQCVERPLLGALAWSTAGRDVAMAVGPYARDGAGARVAADPSCTMTRSWARGMLRALAKVPAAPPRAP